MKYQKPSIQAFGNQAILLSWEEIIEGCKYLVDQYNNVYTCNVSEPEFLGKKTMDGNIRPIQVK